MPIPRPSAGGIIFRPPPELPLTAARRIAKIPHVEPTARHAPLAQLAEQLTLNQRVRGSSPWRCIFASPCTESHRIANLRSDRGFTFIISARSIHFVFAPIRTEWHLIASQVLRMCCAFYVGRHVFGARRPKRRRFNGSAGVRCAGQAIQRLCQVVNTGVRVPTDGERGRRVSGQFLRDLHRGSSAGSYRPIRKT